MTMTSKRNTPIFTNGIVAEHVLLKNGYYKTVFIAPQVAQTAKPGQFVMLSKWNIKELFLKRPFSFYEIEPETGRFSLLYKKVGKGTAVLSESKPGEQVELIGPLGNGFILPEKVKNIAVVARGIGVAPLLPLIRQVKSENRGIYSFLSASSKELLFANELVEAVSLNTYYTTDDGSKGLPGNVTMFLEDLLREDPEAIDVVYTCGSKRLARHIGELQQRYHFQAYISLEERMGCGIGACKGCVVETSHGYQRVCKEGPVFRLEEVVLNA